MQGFDGVTLVWKGETFEVPGDRMMELVLRVEDAIRGTDPRQALQILMSKGGPNTGRLALAYAEALKYAGAKVTPLDVYKVIQTEWADGENDTMTTAQVATMGMLAIISPPMHAKLDALLKKGSAEPGEDLPASNAE